jgi:hypothetical protein
MNALRTWALISALAAMPAPAIWMGSRQPVPVERALANVQTQLRDRPNDASLWLVLARLHSYAFFIGSPEVPARNGEPSLPNIPQGGPSGDRTDLTHLKESIAAFRKSIAIDKESALAHLGLGWDLEQGARYGDRIGVAPSEHAIDAYRRAYDLSAAKEMKMSYFPPGYEAISLEAAERIVAILKQSKPDASARAEITRMEASMAKLRQVGRAITPVIFSFREGVSWRALAAPDVHVAFDLDGLGGSKWSWLQPSTGILVWDPQHTGSIESGLQLFGTATWWMFWRDGFQALSALDDNHDGWLSGAELTGVAVWTDRNQNGRSDPGEVISLAEAGVVRISVNAVADADGILGNPHGIEFSDGRWTPVYDWVSQGEATPAGLR